MNAIRNSVIAAVLALASCAPAYAEDIGSNTVCFVPGPDDCAALAAAEIDKAQHSIG